MERSYWEQKTWFNNVDFTIVGSGIVGLNCALSLRQKYPKSKILVLEKGMLPNGASTKNAGFACFGSLSEICDDLQHHTPEEVTELVAKRWKGLELLRQNLGDKAIGFKQLGGYEIFAKQETNLYESCLSRLKEVNTMLKDVFKGEVFSIQPNDFGFQHCLSTLLFTPFEGQLDTGAMMLALITKAQKEGILLLHGATVTSFADSEAGASVQIENQSEFSTKKLFIATNGFAKSLLDVNLEPARAQVLITKPIPSLQIQGTFHLDRGYYYFRNIDNRILLGGGRNLDFNSENTTEAGTTTLVQDKLEELLKEVILPNTPHEIAYRWSGIMGVGQQKKPIIKQVSNHVFCGVRLGGMGVAIGAEVGKELASFA